MTSSKLALALVVAAGCGSSKADAPATKVVETPPPAPAVVAPVPAKAAAKCGDGKLTLQDSSMREQDRATVFCKDDGTAAILYVLLYQGEVQDKKTVPISIDQWNEIWKLADAANWQTATLQCEPGDEPGYTFHSVEVFRAGTKRESNCDGNDVAGPWNALQLAVFKSQPARD